VSIHARRLLAVFLACCSMPLLSAVETQPAAVIELAVEDRQQVTRTEPEDFRNSVESHGQVRVNDVREPGGYAAGDM